MDAIAFIRPLSKIGKVYIYDSLIYKDKKWSIYQEREKAFWRYEVSRKSYAPDPVAHILPNLRNWGIEPEFFRNKSILEVGSGPISFFSGLDIMDPGCASSNIVVSDSLMDFYQDLLISKMLPERAVLLKCPGEDIPFSDESFDLIVVNNTIDHVQDIDKFLVENRRVLKFDGKIFFSLHVVMEFTKLFYPILKIADKNHPYHFTINEILIILKRCGFRMNRYSVVSLRLEEKIPPEASIVQKFKYFIGFRILHTLYGVIEKDA